MQITKITKVGNTWYARIPAALVRDLKITPYVPLNIKVSKTGEILLDPITPEKYPDLFRVDPSGFVPLNGGQ